MAELSPAEQELEEYRASVRERFIALAATGNIRRKGLFQQWGAKLLRSGNALIALPNAEFSKTRSECQQGFDRYFKGTNIGKPQYVPGVRPNSDFRVLVDEMEYFVLINFDHPDAIDEWEQYCVDLHGASAFRTEYGSDVVIGEIATSIDNETRDVVEEATA